MKTVLKSAFALVFVALVAGCGSNPVESGLTYPPTVKVDSSDVYFGTEVKDPYRWMEAGNSEEVRNWVKSQQVFTENYLATLPSRAAIKSRLTEIWSFEKMSAPFKKAGKVFYYKNNGTQNHSVLYMKDGEKETKLLDPNTFSGDGTIAMSGLSISKDGKYAAYMKSKAGSDWKSIEILDTETGKKLSETLEWIKFSGISWKNDGFFYSRYPTPPEGEEYVQDNQFHKVYYHAVGTNQDQDILIYEDTEHAKRNFGVSVSKDQQIATLSGSETTSGNSLMVANISNWKPGTKMEWLTVTPDFAADIWMIHNQGSKVLCMTNHDAPRYRLIALDLKDPVLSNASDVLGETGDVLESVSIANNQLIAKYLRNVQSYLTVSDMDGNQTGEIDLPGIGIVGGISAEADESEMYFSFVNYTSPASIYRYDLESQGMDVYFEPEINFDSDAFETKQVFYKSKDGTEIPMFITHRKGLEINGNNPVFLFGYGGFNISYKPEFRIDRTVFLENDGIYCVPNIRGGGEFGEEWHMAGTQLQKQNVFDDFIAAAEYLIREGYTNSEKLAIHGRSNGGLLIGACMTQRPDLFKVAVPKVGVLDMLRYHKFTIGWAWVGDYGSSDDEEQFNYLRTYSPVHNVKEAAYPATIVVTGDHDDRVVPAHSFKFISALQAKQQGDNPVIIRIDTAAGHGSGKPVAKQIEEFTDTWTFVFHHLGMEFKTQ